MLCLNHFTTVDNIENQANPAMLLLVNDKDAFNYLCAPGYKRE